MPIRSPTIDALRILFATLLTAMLSMSAVAEEVCTIRGVKANLDFTLKDIDGKDVDLSRFRGHVILLDFWATWCKPCRGEIPHFVALYEQHKQRGFTVLGVSVDASTDLIKPFADELKMSYPVLIGAGRDDLSEAFGPFIGFPTSFLIARDGTICLRRTGVWRPDELERAVAALLQ